MNLVPFHTAPADDLCSSSPSGVLRFLFLIINIRYYIVEGQLGQASEFSEGSPIRRHPGWPTPENDSHLEEAMGLVIRFLRRPSYDRVLVIVLSSWRKSCFDYSTGHS